MNWLHNRTTDFLKLSLCIIPNIIHYRDIVRDSFPRRTLPRAFVLSLPHFSCKVSIYYPVTTREPKLDIAHSALCSVSLTKVGKSVLIHEKICFLSHMQWHIKNSFH